MPIDFGATADDYARYRTSFPPELFARLAWRRIGLPGQRIVDVGTGTGVLARPFAAAGCVVTGVDISAELLAQARKLDGDTVTYVSGTAEDTGLPALVGATGPTPELVAELEDAGFGPVDVLDFVDDVEFTHDTWRGRMRSSQGVGASLPPEQVAEYDAELGRLLARRFPDPLVVPHRIWALVARRD